MNEFKFDIENDKNRVRIERCFSVPIEKIWTAWTQADKLDQWWVPRPNIIKTNSLDFRIGGFWSYQIIDPEGKIYYGKNKYKAIRLLNSITSLDAFFDVNGNLNTDIPMTLWTINFKNLGTSTSVTIFAQFESLEELETILNMEFETAFKQCLENLDRALVL